MAATGNRYGLQGQKRTDTPADSGNGHMRGVGGSDQTARNGVGKKWLDSVYILKVESLRLLDILDVPRERKQNQYDPNAD